MTGSLFSIEGIDGSGKSTTASQVVELLNLRKVPAIYLREPTYESAAGIEVRALLDHHVHIDGNSLMDLFIADRKWDLEHNIQPALDAGKVVIMDRYFISNAVYENSDTWPWRKIMEHNRRLFIEPDAIFILNPGVETCWKRIILRGQEISQYETKSELWRTQEIYNEIMKYDSGNYIEIKNDQQLIYQTAFEIINHILGILLVKKYKK